MAQEHSFLASTNTSKLPAAIGARTVSVCDIGDPVCDYDADETETSPAGIAIHTSYAPAASGSHAWGAPLYNLVASAGPAPTSTIELTAQRRLIRARQLPVALQAAAIEKLSVIVRG